MQGIKNFFENQRRDVRTTGARLVWELNQRRRTLQAEVASLVGQLVRAAHQSQVIYDLGSRAAKILEDIDRAATVEGMLVAATLMDSLEHEVKNTVSKETAPARTRLMRCKSCGEAPKSSSATFIPQQEPHAEAHWKEVTVEATIGHDSAESCIPQAFAGGGETEPVEANTRQEEVEAEAGNNDIGSQGLSGEESDGGMPEEQTSPEVEWPVVCSVTASGGRLSRLRWEDGRVHSYAFTHESQPSHLSLQVHLYITVCPAIYESLYITIL